MTHLQDEDQRSWCREESVSRSAVALKTCQHTTKGIDVRASVHHQQHDGAAVNVTADTTCIDAILRPKPFDRPKG